MEMVVNKNMYEQNVIVKKQTLKGKEQVECDVSMRSVLSSEEIFFIERLLDVKIIFAHSFPSQMDNRR
ncbi:hypothetical protein [Aliivibrio fischeri]|uniref:hypothetical protein n=1 Tax=Aliivibrio fischeri TaxID=668 RepID=UPI00080D9151|nr:hypothetical protein [Aliivibrio fischeri]OCH49065.1 hypothetical protein A6E02_01830 [Aliivibrio fischeri]